MISNEHMLTQKGECHTWNQSSGGSILTLGNILLLEFFSRSKAPNTINANVVCL